MSDQQLRITTFNQLFLEFLDDMSKMFPEDKTLKLVKAGVMGYSVMDDTYLVREFTVAVAPFQDRILKKDEDYFTTHEFLENFGNDHMVMSEINRVINIWKSPTTSSKAKATIWRYIINLVKLGKTIKL